MRLSTILAVWAVSFLGLSCGKSFADASLTSTGNIPLDDLGTRTYKGFQGGLYPNGQNVPPPALAQAAQAVAQQIKPLAADGSVNEAQGKIVLISVGMSNCTMEFAGMGLNPHAFLPRMNTDATKNPKLAIVDCAQVSQVARVWANPATQVWQVAEQRLSDAGITDKQVQVAWIKQANGTPFRDGVFPAHAQRLQADLEEVLRNLKVKFPNLKIAFLSSRTRAYTNVSTALNPEPFAYEEGFSMRWIIEDQLAGRGGINANPAKGAVTAPLVMWGPYLWADGMTPRSDGLTWAVTDVGKDFIHPTYTGGVPKVADQLVAFFKTQPTTRGWLLKPAAGMKVAIKADQAQGTAPVAVHFSADGADGANQFAWTFDDGTFSLERNPKKTFPTPGTYTVRLTASNTKTGDYACAKTEITVNPPSSSTTEKVAITK